MSGLHILDRFPNIESNANNLFKTLPFDIVEHILLKYLGVFDLYTLCNTNKETAAVVHHIYSQFKIDGICTVLMIRLDLAPSVHEVFTDIECIYYILAMIRDMLHPYPLPRDKERFDKARTTLDTVLQGNNMTLATFVKIMMYNVLCLSTYTQSIRVITAVLSSRANIVYNLLDHKKSKVTKWNSPVSNKYESFVKFVELYLHEYISICLRFGFVDLLFDMWLFAYKHYFMINLANYMYCCGMEMYITYEQIQHQADIIGTESAQVIANMIYHIMFEKFPIIHTQEYRKDYHLYSIIVRYYAHGVIWMIHPSVISSYLNDAIFRSHKEVYQKDYVATLTKHAASNNNEIYAAMLAYFQTR